MQVLLNHILPSVEDAATLAAAAPADVSTLLGTMLSTSIVGEDLVVTPAGTTIAAKAVTTDVETCAGIVHVVDKVLVPVVQAAEAPESFAPGPSTTREFAAGPSSFAEGPESFAEGPFSEMEFAEAPSTFVTGVYGDELDSAYGF